MSPQAAKRPRGNPDIGDAGHAAAAAGRDETLKAIKAAQKAIEADIDAAIEKDGFYPMEKLTISAVLRKAGRDRALLEKKQHKQTTKVDVVRWIGKIKADPRRGSKTQNHLVTDRVSNANEELKAVRNAYAIAEMEHAIREEELAKANERIEVLERELRQLLTELAETKVIPISRVPRDN